MTRSPRRRFLFQLAVMAGEWNIGKIERGMTAKRFMEWETYARMEPFNELRADYRAASIREMVFNMAVAVKDRKPLDYFLLKWGEQPSKTPSKQTWQEKKTIAYAIAMAYGKSKEL